MSFSDYNPFCESNRDPGATGNDQCFGVRELNNPFHSSNPTKFSNPTKSVIIPTQRTRAILRVTISASPKPKTDNLQAVLVLVLALLFFI